MTSVDFIPPRSNPLILNFVKAMIPIALKLEKLEVRPSQACLKAIRSMQNRPVLLAVNHIDRCDPSVVAALSLKCQEDFYYLAARELFDENLGLRGWLMQNSGVYSVIRGQPEDKQSQAETISLIAQGRQKLVMFPEGDVTGRDDQILPLKRDGIGNMLEAQKLSLEYEPRRAVQVLPLAIYYEVLDNAVEPLKACLGRQEEFLGLHNWSGPIEARIQRILHCMIRQLEEHYGKPTQARSTDERLSQLCHFIIEAAAAVTGKDDYEKSSVNTFLYSVRGQLQRSIDDKAGANNFDKQLHNENLARFQTAINDLERVQNLLILLSTLEQTPPTIDVLWRIIDRMEQLILGQPSAKGNRIAWIECAQPISLVTALADYTLDKNAAITSTEKLLRSSMQGALEQLKAKQIHWLQQLN